MPVLKVLPELSDAILHRHVEGGEGFAPHDAIDVQAIPPLYLAYGLVDFVIKDHVGIEIGGFTTDLRQLAEWRQLASGSQAMPQRQNTLAAGV